MGALGKSANFQFRYRDLYVKYIYYICTASTVHRPKTKIRLASASFFLCEFVHLRVNLIDHN